MRAVCTTRRGGVSSGALASLNLGLHVGDDPALVQTNRQRVQDALRRAQSDVGAKPQWFFLQQVHGTQVLCLDTAQVGVATTTPIHDTLLADAAMTTLPGRVCVVMVADCLPVLLARRDGRAVAAAHAGWRGLAGVGNNADMTSAAADQAPAKNAGILETTVAQLRLVQPIQAPADDIVAWLGPCIGPTAFEVGDEVRHAFVQSHADAHLFFNAAGRDGAWFADLAGLARLRLHALGISVVSGNNSTQHWCTVSNPEMFFSYRRDQKALGGTGRIAAAVWVGASA